MIPTRDDDVFGVGYFYSDLDPDRFTFGSAIDDSEQGVEAFYNLAITPAVRLTFDTQWFDTPVDGTDNSLLFAVRLKTDL